MEHITISSPTITLPVIGLEIQTAIFWMWVLTLVVTGFSVVVFFKAKKFTEIPTPFQNVVECIVENIRKYAVSSLHEHAYEGIICWALTIGVFLFGTMCLELVGIRSPATDLSVTLAMSLISFYWINYMAFKVKGFKGRMISLAKPNVFVGLMHLVTDVAKPISMACRLFGNVLAGLIIMELIYSVVPILVPAALSIYFNLFHTAIQAYIFITLTFSFIGEAIE